MHQKAILVRILQFKAHKSSIMRQQIIRIRALITYTKAKELLKQDQHIETFFNRQSTQARADYRIRLGASVDCMRFLLKQGLPSRGHDESQSSLNQGNFRELLKFLCNHNENIKRVCENAPKNEKMTSLEIQNDIANAATKETVNAIIKDIRSVLFVVLVDESRDVSVKEQMAVVLRYVDKK